MVKLEAISVAVTNTTAGDVVADFVIDSPKIAVEIQVADNALALFEVWIKLHKEGEWQRITSQSSDYTSPVGFVWGASADLYTLAAATPGWIVLNGTEILHAVRFRAKSASAGGSVVSLRGKAS